MAKMYIVFISIGMFFLQLLITTFVNNIDESAHDEVNGGMLFFLHILDKIHIFHILKKVNTGLKSMFTINIIRNILSGNNLDEGFSNITPGEVVKFTSYHYDIS